MGEKRLNGQKAWRPSGPESSQPPGRFVSFCHCPSQFSASFFLSSAASICFRFPFIVSFSSSMVSLLHELSERSEKQTRPRAQLIRAKQKKYAPRAQTLPCKSHPKVITKSSKHVSTIIDKSSNNHSHIIHKSPHYLLNIIPESSHCSFEIIKQLPNTIPTS